MTQLTASHCRLDKIPRTCHHIRAQPKIFILFLFKSAHQIVWPCIRAHNIKMVLYYGEKFNTSISFHMTCCTGARVWRTRDTCTNSYVTWQLCSQHVYYFLTVQQIISNFHPISSLISQKVKLEPK